MVITDPDNPYLGQYDQEKLVSVSDWYHDQMPTLLKAFVNVKNPTVSSLVFDACYAILTRGGCRACSERCIGERYCQFHPWY